MAFAQDLEMPPVATASCNPGRALNWSISRTAARASRLVIRAFAASHAEEDA